MKTNVLNNGFVRFVNHMGGDLSIVRAARVSYNADWRAGVNDGSDRKLISYLYRNGHSTPFEAVAATFEIKAPIFVVRQWHRHRTQSYNEVSARYTKLESDWYVPEVDQITTQSKSNKQMRTDDLHPAAWDIQEKIDAACVKAFDMYNVLLDQGCPRELARSVLPVSTYTRFFATANLNNWFRFLSERLHPHAQYEIRVYAEAIRDMLKELYPIAVKAFEEGRK